jgi:hypothetical protein
MFGSGLLWLAVAVVGLGLCAASVYASNREHREALERERASSRGGRGGWRE